MFDSSVAREGGGRPGKAEAGWPRFAPVSRASSDQTVRARETNKRRAASIDAGRLAVTCPKIRCDLFLLIGVR